MSTGPKKSAEKAPTSGAKKKPAGSNRVEELKPEAAPGHDLYTAMQDRYGYRGTQRLLRAISAQRATDRTARPASPAASPSIARKPAPASPSIARKPAPAPPPRPRPVPKPVDAPKPAVEEAAIQAAPVVASFAGGAGSEDPPGGGSPARIARREAGDASAPDAGHPAVREALGRVGRGQLLRDALPATMEARPDVHVHADGAADHAAKALHARAFTVGSDIFFARGEYRPGSDDGDRLLRHELTHVAQNARAIDVDASGPARVSKQDDAVEREARAAESGGVPAALTRGGPPVIARDEEKVDSQEYYEWFKVNLWTPVLQALSDTPLPAPANAYWDPDSGAFVRSTLTPLAMSAVLYATIKAVVAPGDLDAAIQTGRALDPKDKGKGPKEYKPAVENALEGLLLPRVNESLQRLAPQYMAASYLAAKNKPRVPGRPEFVDGQWVTTWDLKQEIPAPGSIVGSRPMDRYAIDALMKGSLSVNFKTYGESGAAAQAESQIKTLRKLSYGFEGAEARLIRVSDANPTAEEAAYTLYGDSTLAGSIIDAPPLFGFYPQLLVQDVFDAWQKIAGDKGKDVKRGDVPDTEDPAKAILEGPGADEVALAQARKLKPSGVSKDLIVAAMRASITLIGDISRNAGSGGGEGSMMTRKLEQRAKDLEASTDPAAPLRWDALTMAQRSLLERAAAGAASLHALWTGMADAGGVCRDLPEQVGKPISQVANAYLGVVAVCDLVSLAADRLSQAEELGRALPVVLAEGMLASVRQSLAGLGPDIVRPLSGGLSIRTTVGVGDADAAEMKAREEKLRQRLMEIRALLLKDPSKAMEAIKQIQSEVADLQDQASLAATVDAVSKEMSWLLDHTGKTFIGFVSGKDFRYRAAYDRLSAWYFNRLTPIYWAFKSPDRRADAHKQLRDLQKDAPALQKDMNDVIALAQTEEERERWISLGAKIAALVAITVVTAGVGEWVSGGLLIGAGWGGTAVGTIGAAVVSSGAEAATFTALTTAAFGRDPDKSLLQSFAQNWLLFGAMKGLTIVAEAAVGAKVVTNVAGQGISVIGGLTGQTAIALAEADAKKRKETGKGLTAGEIAAIVGEQLVVLIASALTMRYGPGKAFLEGAKLRGEDSPFFRRFETVDTARNNAMRAIRTLNSRSSVEQARRAVELDTAALNQEAALLKDLKTWAEQNPSLAKIQNVDPQKLANLENITNVQIEARERASLALMLRQVEGDLFSCEPGALEGILSRYEKLGDKVERTAGKREAVVRQKDGTSTMRIVEADPTQRRLAELRQTLSGDALVAFDEILRAAKDLEQALKQFEAMASSPKGLEGSLLAKAAEGPGEKTYGTKAGVYEGVKLDGQQGNWTFKMNKTTRMEGDWEVTDVTTDVTLQTPDATYDGGLVMRQIKRNKVTGDVMLTMDMAFLDMIPQKLRWVNEGGTPLVEGRGTPLQTYVTLMQMKEANVRLGELTKAKMSTIVNKEAMLELGGLAKRKGGYAALDTKDILSSKSGNYGRTNVEQAGSKVATAIVKDNGGRRVAGELRPGTKYRAVDENGVRDENGEREWAKLGLSPDDQVAQGFDIVFTLEKAPEPGGTPPSK